MSPPARPSELTEGLRQMLPDIRRALAFGLLLNVMTLAPSLYMLQVYDRVVNSRNITTLLMLTLIAVVVYAVMELCDWVRKQILHQASLRFDTLWGERVFEAIFRARLARHPAGSLQVMNDFKTLREFFGSQALMALMDLPMAVIFLVMLYAVHIMLGHLALVGAVLQMLVAVLNERSVGPRLVSANRSANEAQDYAAASLRNAEVIQAMGMQPAVHDRWMQRQQRFLIDQGKASDAAGEFSSISRIVQQLLSSLMLGFACWLVISDDFPGGGGLMFVVSTLGGKALSPIVQAIAHWKQLVNARDAFRRLDRVLQAVPALEPGMPLPPPKGNLSVEGISVGAPGGGMPILRGVTFTLPAGQVLGVIGPSASGKSTLARVLVSAWPAAAGKVRLDGVDVATWHKQELGPHVGYLPQDIELFDGTVAENIARFGEIDRMEVEAAARAVGVHDLILSLPEGYDTRIGAEGAVLSGGQRQRIGLARAIYRRPQFIVLDEPNASLDDAGDQALLKTLAALKADGRTLVIVSHRTNILPLVDRLLVLSDGQVAHFGARDEVLAAMQRPAQVKAPAPAPALGAAS